MASLTTLFPTSQFTTTFPAVDQLYVYNTSLATASNGGSCCLWTIPANISWAKFEVWGGGGRGPGGCCCQWPVQSGGAGAYARKTIQVRAGDTYRICAGGSTDCSCACCGTAGFPSYVQTETALYTINLCAQGGPPSCSSCFAGINPLLCVGNTGVCTTGSFCGADFGLPAITGAAMLATCGYQSFQYVPAGPFVGDGVKNSYDYCAGGFSGCAAIGGNPSWPGGGGAGAHTLSGAFCFGQFGAGGLVLITFG